MRHLLSFAVIILSLQLSTAQVEFGIKAGISSYTLAQDAINIPDKDIKLSISDASFGHHAGIYTRIKLLAFYIEPAVLFNSNKVTYKLDQYGEGGIVNQLRSERYNYVDIPVLAGIKMGPVRLQAGVVSHLFINSISDIVDVDGYQQKFQNATYGYQAGVGLDIRSIRVDVNYEGNLTAFGDHITVDDTSYNFGSRPHRIVASVGYKF